MAKVRPSEIIDLTSALEKFGQNSATLEKKILKAIDSGKNLSNSVVKELAKIEKRVIRQQVSIRKEVDKLAKSYDKLSDQERERLQNLKEQYEEGDIALKTLEKLTGATESLTAKSKTLAMSLGAASFAFKALDTALDMITGTFSLVVKAYDNWFRLEQNWMSSMASLRMEHGLTMEQARQAQIGIEALRHEYGNLTSEVDGIAITSQYFGEISNAIRMAGGELTNYATTLAAVRRVTGLTGDSLNQVFRLVATGAPDANRAMEDWMVGTEDLANQLAVPVGALRQDFVAATSDVARFGSQGMGAFRNAATMASRFGLEAAKIFQMVKKFDTFQSGSDAVNQLNAMLGTSISSFELMMETDPTARLERIRQSVMDTGQSWDEMNHFQRDAIAQMLDIPVEEARRLFADNISFEDLENERVARAEAQARDEELRINNTERLNLMLRSTQEIMEDWSRTAQRIWNIVSEAIAPVFREVFGIAEDTRGELLSWVEQLAHSQEFQDGIREIAISVRDIWTQIKEEISNSNVTFDDFKEGLSIAWDIMKGIGSAIRFMYDGFVGLIDMVKDFTDGLSFAWEMAKAVKEMDFDRMGELAQERLIDENGRFSLPGAEAIGNITGNPFLANANADVRQANIAPMLEMASAGRGVAGLSSPNVAPATESARGLQSAPSLQRTLGPQPQQAPTPVNLIVKVENKPNAGRLIETLVDTSIGR